MSEALAAVLPATTLQTCIVHLMRHSLDLANWKERKPLAAALRPIHTAASADAAGAVLEDFARGPWGTKFPIVVASWRGAEDHQDARTSSDGRGGHEADLLALRNITAKWARGPTHWKPAMNQSAILYEGRFTKPSVQ